MDMGNFLGDEYGKSFSERVVFQVIKMGRELKVLD